MDYLWAFVIGGLICMIGQIIVDTTKLAMAHVMVLYVVLGSILTGLGLYTPLVKLAGAGASLPVSNFGHVLTRGILDHINRDGLFGLLSGTFELAGGAIAAAIFFGFTIAIIFRPRA